MAKSCCEAKSSELELLGQKQSTILKWVLFLNASMFVCEFIAGWLASSTALLADSLDMFGDAAVYALSLWAIHRGVVWRNRAGLIKGYVMAAFGILVLGHSLYQFYLREVPIAETMGLVGSSALAVNALCLFLLYSHRADDINMRSTWICSRNDIVANCGVLVASYLVATTGSGWPDLLVGSLIAILFLSSARGIITEARTALA